MTKICEWANRQMGRGECREQAAKVSPFVPPLMCCYQLTMAEEEIIINNSLDDWTAATRFNICRHRIDRRWSRRMKRSVLNISNERTPTSPRRSCPEPAWWVVVDRSIQSGRPVIHTELHTHVRVSRRKANITARRTEDSVGGRGM